MKLIAGPEKTGLRITYQFGGRRQAKTHSIVIPAAPGKDWQSQRWQDAAETHRKAAEWLESLGKELEP